MLTETGQSLAVPEEQLQGINLITAILPHPIHGRLTEFPLLMVNKQNQRGRGTLRFGLARRRPGLLPAGHNFINRSGNLREGAANRSPFPSF